MNPRYQIVIINDFLYVNGGAGQVALSSAAELAKRNHQVIVFGAVGPVGAELVHKNIRVICTDQRDILTDPKRIRAGFQGIWNIKAAELFGRLLDTLDRSDTIIHIHTWTKALSSSVVRVAVRKGFKIVCTMHDYFLACPNGGFFNYPKNKICHLSPLSLQCIFEDCDMRCYSNKLWRIFRHSVQKGLGLMPSGIKYFIAVSPLSMDILQPYLPKGATVFLIENPVNIEKFAPVDVKKNQLFLFIGRLSREKGPHLFAEVASKLGIEAVFVGDGPLRREISNICPFSLITGWLDHSSMRNFLAMARAVVVPSLLYETQGLVVYEAAAMGIPAVVSDSLAARAFIEDGKTGLWFKTGDVDDLARKIKLLHDDEAAEQMGKAVYAKYWSYPKTIDMHIESLERCYDYVINRNAASLYNVHEDNGSGVWTY